MEFDTKIKIILRNDLLTWQALNVTAFLISGIAATQNIVGLPYQDGSGVDYLPMSQQPIMIHAGSKEQMLSVLRKAIERQMAVSIYTEELFHTFNDVDNRAVIAQYLTDDLNLVGIAIRGKKTALDKMTKSIDLYK